MQQYDYRHHGNYWFILPLVFTILHFTFIILSLHSCSPALRSHYATISEVEIQETTTRSDPPEEGRLNLQPRPCTDPASYVPDTNHLELTPYRYLRLNIHFVDNTDSTANFQGKTALDFANQLVHTANEDLRKNHQMWLPPRNTTPVLPPRYQYVLTPQADDPGDSGIYFHYDDELCYYIHKGRNANLTDRRIIDRYAVQPDSVLNIFIMPHHPDSIDSPTYNAAGVGVALGNAIKVAGAFEHQSPGWAFRGILNHECGHILGLSHAWTFNDGCDDTPQHPANCWNRTETPPCDTMASNNVMDYNARQHAWTPCQIGRIHYAMANISGKVRPFLRPDWCRFDPATAVVISDTLEWNGAKDLHGNLTIAAGGFLQVNCRLSLPRNARITITPGATLSLGPNAYLHNACDDQWMGIEIQEQGSRRGRLILQGDPIIENALNPLR